MLFYNRYFRQFGIRRLTQLTAPLINDLSVLDLPRNSIYHYLPEDSVAKGPSPDHWAARNAERLVMVEHIEALGSNAQQGSPRRTAVQPQREILEYHRRYRRLKRLRFVERELRDVRTPLIVNYGLLSDLYRYTQSMYSRYYEHANLLATLVDQINSHTSLQRQQFLSLTIPTPLPALSDFRRAAETVSQPLLDTFSTVDRLYVLELWRWMGPQREFSVFNKLTPEALAQCNLVIQFNAKWMWLNLGVVDAWRRGLEEHAEGDLTPDVLQKRFLRLMVSLFETATADIENVDSANTVVETTPKKPTANKSNGPDKVTDGPDKDTIDDEVVVAEDVKAIVQQSDKHDTDEKLDEDLDALRRVAEAKTEAQTVNPFTDPPVDDYDNAISVQAQTLAGDGIISPAELRRYETLAETYKKLPNPYTGKGSIAESLTVTAEDTAITAPTVLQDNPAILDKSMLETTLQDFDSRYVDNVLTKDVLNHVMSFQQAGVAVTDYTIRKIEDVANEYEMHTVKLNPMQGKSSTIHFKLPVIQPDGTWKSNNVNYRLRKGRRDLPIRKINSSRVALSSYYGKIFVDRSEKVVNNYGLWLTKTIRELGLSDNNTQITNLKSAKVISSDVHLPRLLTILGGDFLSFSGAGIDFYFNYDDRITHFGQGVVDTAAARGMFPLGMKGQIPVVCDQAGALYLLKAGDVEPLGTIEEVLDLGFDKAPVDIVEIMVNGKMLPLGIVLGYYVGLKKVITHLPGTTRWVTTGRRVELKPQEFAIRFRDETLIVNREDQLAAMILGSLRVYRNGIAEYDVNAFESKDVYFNLLTEYGLNQRHLNELDLLDQLFIDSVTKEILMEMKEPTHWVGLLRRAAELLLTDYAPSEVDMRSMRITGYERMAGAVHLEVVKAMRQFNSRRGNPNVQVEMHPFAVWETISKDPSQLIVEESNPIKNINETESVTFTGVGGRNKVGLVPRTRIFDKNDMGIISEATVDSGDVAVTTYTTANPRLTSIRGMVEPWQGDAGQNSSLLSTVMLTSPCLDSDDPKRANFATIQHGQGIGAMGYQPMPLRTGYERIIPQRTGDMFAVTAKKPGTVVKTTKDSITVEYKDGSRQSFELGRRFGVAAGNVYPHDIVTGLKQNDTFKPGDTLCYNTNFFSPDPFNAKEVLYKPGVLAKVALMESNDTFEDSSAISVEMAKKLGTRTAHTRDLFFDFDVSIRNLVKPGDAVDPESILCTIEDAVSTNSDLFTDETIDTLRLLSANTPRAQYGGVVEKVEILYYGDREDMSDSLGQIVDNYNAELAKKRKALGKSIVDARVDDSIRIGKTVLELDTVFIRVYITDDVTCSGGDKAVFSHQLKTVIARVMEGTNETESGEAIDACFGYNSISARIVYSAEAMGTTNTLLRVLSKRVADIYFDGKSQ